MLHVTVVEAMMAESGAQRVQRRREVLRKAGLRPIQIWVPDTRQPWFARECARQSRLIQRGRQDREILNWIERAVDLRGWK